MTTNALAAFGGTGLVTREELGAFLNTAATAIPQGSVGSKQFLKISDKDGAWTFGAEETVVEEDSLWAINPVSFFHGYIAWHDAKPEGEHRSSVRRPLPPVESLPVVKAQNGWQQQYGFDLVCVSGEDADTVCEFKSSSTGGKRAVGALISALNERFATNPDTVVPIVRLRDNKYYDKKYKKDQFPPVFEIVEWRTLDDTSAPTAPAAAAPKTATNGKAPEPPAAGSADEDKALAAEYAATQAQQGEAVPRRRVRR